MIRRATRYLTLLTAIAGCTSHRDGDLRADSMVGTSLPPIVTGKLLEDRLAEASADVGSLPMNLIPTPDGQYALSSDMGAREAVCAVRISDGKETGRVDFQPKPADKTNGLYYGLAVGPDGTVYAAQGGHAAIATLKLAADGSLTAGEPIKARAEDFPAGLALDARRMLFVANNDPGKDGQFGTPASVAIYDTASRTEVGRYTFGDTFAGTSNFPLCLAVLKDGSKCYVASQRDGCVYVLDARDAKAPKLLGKIASGAHPSGLLFNKDQSKLFIANAHSDTISVVKTADDSIAATVLLRPEIARDLPGATPLGMALSPDEKTLYAALGDMNAVAVIDVQAAALKGYVPAGWYPTGVVASADGKRVLVTNAKGNKTRVPNMPVEAKGARGKPRANVSPLTLLEGNVATLAVPTAATLTELTQRVMELNKLTPRYVKADNPLKDIGLQAGKITHVIYIIKENRTYDQVLGDEPAGNGDPNLAIFGREVTPNLHALAERFVLLDNFYDCGEVSGDGWVWSTQGHANEYAIKNVPYYYSHRGRDFDFEGTNGAYPTGGFPAKGPDGKPMSEDPLMADGGKPVPDVAEAPGGHIWDAAIKAKLTYRNYGCFVANGVKRNGKIVIPDNYPAVAALQPGGHDLAGVTDVDYRKFNLDYADSQAPKRYADETKDKQYLRPDVAYGKYAASCRFEEWNREFQMMLAKDPSGGAVPNFVTIRMGDDHTMGANPLKHTPRSMVADNDYGVGQIVEAVSHSPIWTSTAIVVLEDDAQNGPDHVDAHRSVCYVISPWIKARSVDHSFQNTVSALKTMECLLGLPPMSQYDAVATPILDWDKSPANAAPFDAIAPSKALIAELNAGNNPVQPVSPEQKTMIEQSKKMDFTVADRAPADLLNAIIWQTVKGPGAVMPASPHGPVLPVKPGEVRKVKDDDDDD